MVFGVEMLDVEILDMCFKVLSLGNVGNVECWSADDCVMMMRKGEGNNKVEKACLYSTCISPIVETDLVLVFPWGHYRQESRSLGSLP